MLDEGFDPGVAQERVKGQGCEPVGIIEGPCGYPTRLVGTQGKLVFRETLGESVQNRCFGGVRQRLVTRARGKASGCDPVGVVEGPCGYPAG